MIQILITGLLLFSSPLSAITIQWIPTGAMTSEGKPDTILGKSVIEYRNAGAIIENEIVVSTFDWVTSGIGPIGSWKSNKELWLLDDSAAGVPGTSEATTQFSVISNSVSFVMAGDHNDGFAQFFVNDMDVGTFNLFERGHASLVVTGLDAIRHSLKIVQLGLHVPEATKGDIAIFGGAAFNIPINPDSIVSEPNILGLIMVALMIFYRARTFRHIPSNQRYT